MPPQHLAWLLDLTCSPRRKAEAAVSNSNPHASQDQELRMDRSLTYFDDVAAIKVSLQLMQKRSGVPLLRFTSTFEVPPFENTLCQVTHIHAGNEAYVTPIRSSLSLRRTFRFYWQVNQLLRWDGISVNRTSPSNQRKIYLKLQMLETFAEFAV